MRTPCVRSNWKRIRCEYAPLHLFNAKVVIRVKAESSCSSHYPCVVVSTLNFVFPAPDFSDSNSVFRYFYWVYLIVFLFFFSLWFKSIFWNLHDLQYVLFWAIYFLCFCEKIIQQDESMKSNEWKRQRKKKSKQKNHKQDWMNFGFLFLCVSPSLRITEFVEEFYSFNFL